MSSANVPIIIQAREEQLMKAHTQIQTNNAHLRNFIKINYFIK